MVPLPWPGWTWTDWRRANGRAFIQLRVRDVLRTSPVRRSREFGAAGLSEVQIQTIGTRFREAPPLAMVHLRGTKKLGFVLMEAPPGMTGRFFVAVEP